MSALRERLRVALAVDQVTHDAGTERQVAETIRRMNHSEFEVHLICFEDSARFRELAAISASKLFPLESIFSVAGLRGIASFRRYLIEHRIDVVMAYMLKASAFAVLARLPSFSGKIVTCRLNTGYWYTPGLLRWTRFLNRFTDRVVANSEGARQIAVAAEGLPADRVDVIYQGVDMDVFSPARVKPGACRELGIAEGSRVVGIVANLRPVKDHDLFLRAAAIVARRIPDAVFLLAGRGELQQPLEALASELGIRDRVYFTHGEGSVAGYLADMSIGCLTSQSEGFSNAILEYMAMGLPVVATDVGGNAEAIGDEAGFLVRDRTPEAFAAPVIRLLEDEPLRAAMGAKAQERCRSRFEIDLTIRDLENYLRRIA
jgi:glycosyltransferase involved in cell wall biosynthesis